MSASASASASSGYNTEDGGEDEHLHLSAGLVLSQLELPDLHMLHDATNESLNKHFPAEVERMMGNATGKRRGHRGSVGRKTDKMLKEMKSLRRQNIITHCLLGTMIVLTLGWQLSEVSLILTLKDGLTHPFRSIGKLLSRMVKRRKDSVDATEEAEPWLLPAQPSPSPSPSPMLALKMPKLELPRFLDVSKWGQNGNAL